MKRGQKGFTIVETLLVLILLAILGFTGYYVWHTRNNTNSSYNSAANTASSTPSSATASFIFKGLGVQFDPKNDLKGLKYQISDGNYYLSDDAFIKSVGTCPDSNFRQSDLSNGGFAAISKTSGQYPTDANPIATGVLLKQFPDFWISYGFPNGSFCSDTSKAQSIQNTAATEANKFFNDFQKTASLSQ